MSGKRPGAGVRVSGGRLRVDAARAIDKLRSYQLADPLAWVLEVVRAGVSFAESEAIAVEGDGGDVFVAITCDPPSAERLPRLFEELVDPSPALDARGLRLLAMGVNAALGRVGTSATRYVDVYVIDAEGAWRVRFTPQLFEVEEETGVATGLRSLRAERLAPPPHAPRPRRGLLVHTRAVMGLGLLARWAVGEEPRELALVRDAARELRVPMTVQGLPVPVDPSIVLREPLTEGGYVALALPRAGRLGAMLEAAEMGVVLSREPWNAGVGIVGARVPLLLRVDRERLPTNAARSAVRWDEPVAATALEEAKDALKKLIVALAKEIDRVKEPGRLSWLRTLGLTLLAADVGGIGYRERLAAGAVSSVLEPLLDAQLLYDAVGRRRTPRSLARANEPSVHFGNVFLGSDVAPWLGDVLAAMPGDPTHLLFGDLPPASAAPLVERAVIARRNEARWLALPIEPPMVKERGVARIALPKKLWIRGRDPLKLEGEIVLGVPGEERLTALHLRGRRLDTRRVQSGVGIACVASCEGLRPTMTYDGVVDDEVLLALDKTIDEALYSGCEAIARALVGEKVRESGIVLEDATGPRATALVRYGIQSSIARDADAARRTLFGKPLGRAPAWPRVDGGEVALSALTTADAIGTVQRGRPRPTSLPRKRPVLALTDGERTSLRLLFPRTPFVDYERVTKPPRTLAEITLTLAGRLRVGLTLEGDGFVACAAWCDTREAGIEAFHMGVRLGYHAIRGSAVPVVIVVDDEWIVPDETWSSGSVSWSALEERVESRMAGSRIARAVVRRWLGEPVPNLVHHVALDSTPVVRAVMREAQAGFEERLTQEERATLTKLPLLPGLRGEPTSADALRIDHSIAYVPEGTFPPGYVRDLPIDALLGSHEEAKGVAVLMGGGVIDATSRVRDAIAKRQRDKRLEALARTAKETVDIPGASPTVRMLGDGLEGVVAFHPRGGSSRVSVLVDGHWLLDLEDEAFPPYVRARVSIEARLLDDVAAALSDAGDSRVRGALLASARALLLALVAARPMALFGEPAVRALASHLAGSGRRRGEVGAMLRALMDPATLVSSAGTPLSITDAIHDDALLTIQEAIAPVGPADGEEPTIYDRSLAVVPWPTGDERRVLLERIAGVTLRDVSREARAVYASRRAARGLVARPTLGRGHEASLSRTVEALVAATPDPSLVRTTLGFGIIGLSPAKRARVRFFQGGVEVDALELDLVPSFEAAVESPVLGALRAMPVEARADVERAVTMLLAQLLRRLADENAFDGAPDWALDGQLGAALLGGATHLERLGPLRLFRTTAGTRVSYAQIQEQRQKLGPVWWTPDPSESQVPLDPERFVLSLSVGHGRELGRAVSLMDGTKELALDAIARRNRSKPPVASIALNDTERAASLGSETEREDDYELVVAPLWPAFAAMQSLGLHLRRQSLGTIELASEIPALARVTSSELVPNRTWTGVEHDGALAAIQRSIGAHVDAIVAGTLRAPSGPFPSVQIDRAFMGAVPRPKGRVVRGSLTLGPIDLEEGDDDGVRLIDRRARDPEGVPPRPRRATPPKRLPVVVPLEGTLVLWQDDASTADGTIDAVLRHAYTQLLAQISSRLMSRQSPDRDLDLAHLVRGAELGFAIGKDVRLDVPIPFGLGTLDRFEGIVDVLGQTTAVVALAPDDDRAHDALARYRMFVADGSLAAQRFALALGPRAITRSDALALVMGLRKPEKTASIPPPAPAPKKASPKAPTKPAKKAKAPRVSSGPVEPLAARTAAMLKAVRWPLAVVVATGRDEPLVERTPHELALAGRSQLLALAAGTTVHRERSAALIAGHVVTTGDGNDPMSALARLLE